MFNLIKKRNLSISAVCNGELIPITEVNDDVFSSEMLGDGHAIKPAQGKIYSPVDGIIKTIFPTKHAIGVSTDSGLELLIHLGIDTVELNGKPFEIFTQQGDIVKTGDLIADMDIKLITSEGYDNTVVIVYTNPEIIKAVSFVSPGAVEHGKEVQTILFKN